MFSDKRSIREMLPEDIEIVAMSPEDLDLDREYDVGFGSTEMPCFTIWTEDRVYFPACYDGSEWIESVPRNPCDEATAHIGGG